MGNVFGAASDPGHMDHDMMDTPRGSVTSVASEGGPPSGSNMAVDFARQNKEATNKAVLAKYLTTAQLKLRAASANEAAEALMVTYQQGTHGHQWQLGTELHITADMEQYFSFAPHLLSRHKCMKARTFHETHCAGDGCLPLLHSPTYQDTSDHLAGGTAEHVAGMARFDGRQSDVSERPKDCMRLDQLANIDDAMVRVFLYKMLVYLLAAAKNLRAQLAQKKKERGC